jgi:peptidoglycan/xylan/chitin deacetylase (PgdA/CDA1 family)
MLNLIRHTIRRFQARHAIILMYHQVSEQKCDPWNLAVAPCRFEEQMSYISRNFDVVCLDEIASAVARKKVRKKMLAITFDDGFADNYTNARPILESYGLPATFYLSTSMIDSDGLYWWNELQDIVLHTHQLPTKLELKIENNLFKFSFATDHILNDTLIKEISEWNAEQEPCNERVRLFIQIWERLQPLTPIQQKLVLRDMKAWAETGTNQDYHPRIISFRELNAMAKNPLFTLGAHTVNHTMLANHSAQVQVFEIKESKKMLEGWLGKRVTAFAYPYGNYNNVTRSLIEQSGFNHAVSTENAVVNSHDDVFALPRIQVKNWGAKEMVVNFKRLAK